MNLHHDAEIAQLLTLNRIRHRIVPKTMFQVKRDREHRTCEYCGALWLGVEDRCFNGHSEMQVFSWTYYGKKMAEPPTQEAP